MAERDDNKSHSDALKTSGIEQLKSPGINSNYLDWSFVVELHLQACKVGYVLEEVAPKNRLSNWKDDNVTVCSVITKTVESSNYRHVRDHRSDAQAMWLSLRSAHQDFTAGGRMYWLRKLVLYRMSDEDVDKHLDSMTVIYEKLNALVTPSSPLTADDVFATALLISVPPTWLHSISHLLNSPCTSSSQIVSCLKAESNRRASSIDDLSHTVSVSKASTSFDKRRFDSRTNNNRIPRTSYNQDLNCSFCKASGHDLSTCKTAARVLNDHKDSLVDEFRKLKHSKPQSKKSEKVSKTKTVSLGSFSDDDSDSDSSSTSRGNERARAAVIASASRVGRHDDWTVDSACLKSMMPEFSDTSFLQSDKTIINLADDSTIVSSHRTQVHLPVLGDVSINALIVPELHDPLLSVADLCDKNLAVVFRSDGCKIYHSSSVDGLSPVVGEGYQKDNLFYLPREVSSLSVCLATSTSSDITLLDYHHCLNHIGVRPLKKLLRLQNIHPTVMNEIDVQKCDICVQGKLHRSPLRSRKDHRSDVVGGQIFSDVGSYEVVSREGYKYYITFVDDCSKAVYVNPMKFKSDSFNCFKIFRSVFEKTKATSSYLSRRTTVVNTCQENLKTT